MDQTQSNVTSEENRSSTQLRNDIRHTRNEMDETLDQLGERLQPRKVLDELLDLFSSKTSGSTGTTEQISSTLRKVGKSTVHYIRENPVPSLLMTAGLAWAIYDAAMEEDESSEWETEDIHRRSEIGRSATGTFPEEEEGSEAFGGAWESSEATASRLGNKASDAAANLREAGASSWRSTKRAGRRGYRKAGEISRATADYAERGMERTREGYYVLRDRFEEASDNYPLAVAGGFIAAGLLTGLLLPRTRTEDEWMGETADEAWDQIRETGEEVVEKGKQVATKSASAAMEEAESQGLSLEQLSEKANRVASKAGEAAKQSAEEETHENKRAEEINLDPQAFHEQETGTSERSSPLREG